MAFFAIIFIILPVMSFLTLSTSHVIKEKSLALLTLCGYGSETIVRHFLQ